MTCIDTYRKDIRNLRLLLKISPKNFDLMVELLKLEAKFFQEFSLDPGPGNVNTYTQIVEVLKLLDE